MLFVMELALWRVPSSSVNRQDMQKEKKTKLSPICYLMALT